MAKLTPCLEFNGQLIKPGDHIEVTVRQIGPHPTLVRVVEIDLDDERIRLDYSTPLHAHQVAISPGAILSLRIPD